MTIDDFEKLATAYGAELSRWPRDKRDAARDFAARYPQEAQLILADAVTLDRALDAVILPLPSDLLRSRILKTAKALPQDNAKPARSSSQMGWKRIAAMIMIAFGGGFAGANYMFLSADSGNAEIYADDIWAGMANDLDFAEIYSWVEGTDVASDNDLDDI
jgi:hypothetical protein